MQELMGAVRLMGQVYTLVRELRGGAGGAPEAPVQQCLFFFRFRDGWTPPDL